MLLDTSSDQDKETSLEAETPAEAMKRKFRRALFWINLGIDLPFFIFLRHNPTSPHQAPFFYFLNSHQWIKLFSIFGAVCFFTIAIYLIVDTFYRWPGEEA